jgi:hypothetical protein
LVQLESGLAVVTCAFSVVAVEAAATAERSSSALISVSLDGSVS